MQRSDTFDSPGIGAPLPEQESTFPDRLRRLILSSNSDCSLRYSCVPKPMGKPKRRGMLAVPASQNDVSSDFNLHVDDSWVMVKKQKVTIMIPLLPHVRKPTMPKSGLSKPEAMLMEPEKNISTVPTENCTGGPSVDEQEMIDAVALNKSTQMTIEDPAQHLPAPHKLLRLNATRESENADHPGTFKSSNMLGVSNISKMIKHPNLWHGPSNFLDGSMVLHQSLRASLLERKLQKAGGLSRWLASLGLGQFVRIFHGKSVDKFQLVNLTMKKLKDMGANAVGPRRKLMHAIDCICQPYCFETR
uniref:Uncharacterized protein MANES_08G038100 n=1 Tax=Rhizophora mucronata TaxID=61149 RepID=A0A2P2J529_RHIMU